MAHWKFWKKHQEGRGRQGRLQYGRSALVGRWPALVFALVIAVAGGLFVWRSFANPLDSTVQQPTASATGDLDQDGLTSLADMSRLLSVYGSQDRLADLDGDGKVDASDLSILLSRYAAPQTPSPADQPPVTDDKPEAAPAPQPAPAPAAAVPAPSPAPVADTTPPPAQEIASEIECPNQTDPTLPASVQYDAVQCMNAAARRYHKLSASKPDAQLMQSAAAKAQDVARCEFSHTACGTAVSHWFVQKGFKGRCYAENLGQNQKTVRQVFIQWMESPPHRADILNPIYVGLGVAVAPSERGLIWVQHFGGCYR